MCRKNNNWTCLVEYDADACVFGHNSWSKVFGGSCGRFIIFCFFLCLILFITMVIYIAIYTSSILNHPNIICLPSFSFFSWGILMPACWVFWLMSILCTIRLSSERKKTMAVVYTIVVFAYAAIFILLPSMAPFSAEHGVIIREDNTSNIMFQYLYERGDRSEAYPIFLHLDNINDTYPNSTCDFWPFSNLCPLFGPLRGINVSGAFRCSKSSAEEDFEPLLLYMKPLLGLANTAMNLCIAFSAFFILGFALLMKRRLFPSERWIENQLCWPSLRGEYTRIV